MKTVQKGEDIKRVKEDDAEHLVRHKGYKYVPKSTRKLKRVKEEEVVVIENDPQNETKESSPKKGKDKKKK